MRPPQLLSKLNRFLGDGNERRVFEAVTYHSLKNIGSREQKIEPNSHIPMVSAEGVTVEEYLQILEKNSYSAVFDDGAVIIIQVTFKQNNLHSHRYIYIPCPIAQKYISKREADMLLADWIRIIIDEKGTRPIISSGYLRFDCVREHEQSPMEPHPISHMTFISGSCRVPVYRPLTIASFFNFIFDNYYRKHLSFWLKYSAFLNSDGIEDTITAEEQTFHHLDWCPD